MIDQSDLQPIVERWLPTQRWFSGKGRNATVDVSPLTALAGAPRPVEIWVADVTYDDGVVERYQIPLVLRDQPEESLEYVLLGTITTDTGPMWIYDALHDKDATGAWLEGMRNERDDDGLRFRRYVAADEIPLSERSLVFTGEQSNTSVMFSDEVIMKVYRKLQPGTNPDLEIHAALARLESAHVVPLVGSVEYAGADDYWTLAMAQAYMTTATDGWELAKSSVRDLLNARDLHADEAGGDFAGESMRLGVAVAETHADLVVAFGTTRADRGQIAERAAAMRGRLDAAVQIVPELGDFADGLRAVYDEFESVTDELLLQRIHGDLHLGQVLRTSNRWVLIDFEGEPMADLASRGAPDTFLRDIAGMLRSFDYAGFNRLVEDPDDQQLAYRAREWSQRNRDAFCDGYQSASGSDPRDQGAALRAFEADKAVYETVYEARNRPTWLPIPLISLERLASSEQST